MKPKRNSNSLKKLFENSNHKAVEEYKSDTIKKAEDLITNDFPCTILKLNEIIESCDFRKPKLNAIHQSPNSSQNVKHEDIETNGLSEESNLDVNQTGTKVYEFSYGPVPCNKRLCELIDLAKPYMKQLIDDANLLRMWISFLIPKIEDGNNFGVSVQEDTLYEIRAVETEGAVFFEQISRYFVSRAKMITKVAKYPHVDDYRKAVEEIDEREYLSVWLAVCEVRNRYSKLHDIIIKNIDKIRTPRSINIDSLY